MKLAIALALVIASAGVAEAGDRQAEILLIDATSSPGAPGRRCTDGIAQRIGKEYVVITRRDLAAVLPKLGANPPAAILAWTEALLAPLRRLGRNGQYDAVIVMDCRPDARALDLVVDAVVPGAVTYRLRAIELDAAVLDWIVADVMAHAWAGFSP